MQQTVENKLPSKANKKRLSIPMEYVLVPGAMLLAMAVVWAFTGHWPTDENPYRNYTLQALAWLDGRLELDMNYTWLELAVFEGKHYVSFPPFPSFVMLPFAAVFGPNTPDHLVSLVFTVIGVIYALKIYRQMEGTLENSEKYVLFLFLANGYLFISIQGWVWYMAQVMCFCLSLMALYYALKGRGGLSLAFWACAVGCRPMVILYLPLLLWLMIHQWKSQPESGGILAHGDGVQVCQGVQGVVAVLQADPVFKGAQVVAQGDGAAGLNGAENNLFVFSVLHKKNLTFSKCRGSVRRGFRHRGQAVHRSGWSS